MIHDVRYVNSRGDEMIFGGKKNVWRFGKTDIFNIDLDYEETGGTITSFGGGIKKLSMLAVLRRGDLAQRNRLVDVLSYDTRVRAPGTLYAGGSYLKCYMRGIDFEGWNYDDGDLSGEIEFVSDEPVWVRAESQTLMATSLSEYGGLNYPHNFPHNYGYSSGTATKLVNPFMLPCRCDIVFPGPCVNPYVIIAGNRYQVLTTAEKGHLVMVKGFAKSPSITVRAPNGTERNIFSQGVREDGARIFAEVPVGEHIASWSGANNIEVTLYEERWAPLWT